MPYKVKQIKNQRSPPNLAYLSEKQINTQIFDLSNDLITSKFANVGGLNGMIIKLAGSTAIADDEIQLTPEQMKYLSLVEGDSVKVEPIPQGMYELITQAKKIETFLYTARYERTKNARDIEPSETPGLAMVNNLKLTLENQVLYKGQKIAFNYNGKDLMLVVDEIVCAYGENNELTPIPKGVLSNATQLTVTAFEKNWSFPPGVDPDEIVEELQKRGIGGLNAIIEDIVESVFKVQYLPKKTKERITLRAIKGILFHGPPGTGKTLIARNLSDLLLCVNPVVAGSEIVNKYHGQSEKNLRDLFKEAKKDHRLYGKKSPLHVFIFDEFESIAKKRMDDNTIVNHNDSLVAQLLTLLDGVEQLPNILILATTNRLHVIDDAVTRPGRVEKLVLVKYPEVEDRLHILQLMIKPYEMEELIEKNIDLGQIAALMEGFSGSDLQSVVQTALSKALLGTTIRQLSRLKGNGDLPKITAANIQQAVEEMRASKAAAGGY